MVIQTLIWFSFLSKVTQTKSFWGGIEVKEVQSQGRQWIWVGTPTSLLPLGSPWEPGPLPQLHQWHHTLCISVIGFGNQQFWMHSTAVQIKRKVSETKPWTEKLKYFKKEVFRFERFWLFWIFFFADLLTDLFWYIKIVYSLYARKKNTNSQYIKYKKCFLCYKWMLNKWKKSKTWAFLNIYISQKKCFILWHPCFYGLARPVRLNLNIKYGLCPSWHSHCKGASSLRMQVLWCLPAQWESFQDVKTRLE